MRLAVVCAIAMLSAAAPAAAKYFTFESGQVRPLAMAPDGTQLYAVNTPDDRLEIFDVSGGSLTHVGSVPVGMEPVAVAVRPNGNEAWVVNHLSDSVSIVDLTATPPRVVRTLLVGDEPRDIVFAGTGGNRAFITTARRGQNTALQATIDTLLRTEGVGRADVWVFDATNLGASLGGTPVSGTPITVFSDTPRALAVSPDGNTVYAAAFHSGNQTTTINESAVCDGGSMVGACGLDGINMPNGLPGGQVPGGLPFPNRNFENILGPETGLIVKFNNTNNRWEDNVTPARNWTNGVRFSLPDLDVFAIDADAVTPVQSASFAHVGTVLFNMVTNPVSGKVYVTNTEANNLVRFEGPGGGGTTVRGHLAESRITVLDGVTVTPRHLNKHIDYNDVPQPVAVKDDSLATPTGMAVTQDGQTLYVAAFGSSKVGVFNTTQLENNTFTPNGANNITVTGGGPSGVVLDEANDRLYVFTRFDNSISVINTNTNAEIAHLPVYNPEPTAVVDGRSFLYDAHFTSSTGEASCSSCHIFGDFDSLAWDLGNPDEVVVDNPNPAGPIFGGQDFHPMKGPMTTQTLRGMDTHGPMHWRGDRTGGYANPNVEPNGGAFDENAAFLAFNVAFDGLLGRDEGPLTPAQMQAFTSFILQVVLPPNPIRGLDNELTPDQQAGLNVYNGPVTDTVATCNGCHALNPSLGFFGADARSTFENETQEFKIAHLRNMYQKVGMFGMPSSSFIQSFPGENNDTGQQVRGFGFLHDGSIDTLFRFHRATVFNLNDTQRRQLESLMFAFDSTLAPVVGQQITLTNSNGATVDARIDLFIDSAEDAFALLGVPGAHECDLVAKGVVDGEERGYLYDPTTDTFQGDREDDPPLTDAALRALIDTANESLTYTCGPPSSGTRMALDRDEDGFFDSDEIDAGSDPADPGSTPGSATPTPTVTPTAPPVSCSTPEVGCKTAGKGMLLIKGTAGKEKLTWKFLKGNELVDVSEVGDPTASTNYALCIYTSPVAELQVAGGAGWATAGTGFKFKDTGGAQDGITKVLIKPGEAGKSKVLVKGKGGNLPLPMLPVGVPVTVQLKNSDGTCWETVFSSATKSTTDLFKAKF